MGDVVSLRIRGNTSCLLSQRYRSLQRSHPSVICFANATSPWHGEARGSALFARLCYVCGVALTSRPPLSRGSKCPGDTSVKSKARQRTLILLARRSRDWGVATQRIALSLQSCSLRRFHPSTAFGGPPWFMVAAPGLHRTVPRTVRPLTRGGKRLCVVRKVVLRLFSALPLGPPWQGGRSVRGTLRSNPRRDSAL